MNSVNNRQVVPVYSGLEHFGQYTCSWLESAMKMLKISTSQFSKYNKNENQSAWW